MFQKDIIVLFFITFCTLSGFSQKDTINDPSLKKTPSFGGLPNPLAPSKAAFYSAIFPAGGQIYNKKYWKAPIVWFALGTSTYFYLDNNSEYKRYRTAYKQRKNGFKDEFTLDDGTELISITGLERAQKTLRGNRDVSILSTLLIYSLQILEASVNAHLLAFDASDHLTVHPTIIHSQMQIEKPSLGFSFKYNF